MRSGTILIGYDGSQAAEHALREGADLLAPRPALVVVIWKAGLAFELIELPASSIGLPPADEALVRLARERAAQAIVVGAHAHGNLLGSTSRGVVRRATCPVLVVRERTS